MRTNLVVASCVHDDVGDVGADVDDGFIAFVFEIHADAGRAHRAHHGERHQVEAQGFEFGAGGARHEHVDHAALRGDQQHPQHPAIFLLELTDRVVVQDGLVDGHRDELLHLEPEGGPQLLLRQVRQSDLAHHDALVPHAQVDTFGFEASTLPELAERLGDQLGFADLAVLDGPGGQRDLGGVDHRRGVSADDLHGSHRGGSDVEPDPTLRH